MEEVNLLSDLCQIVRVGRMKEDGPRTEGGWSKAPQNLVFARENQVMCSSEASSLQVGSEAG